MGESLISVGLDVGTTSTQMVVSRLELENRAGAFAVPELEIGEKQILYRSPVHFTPMLDEKRIDGEALGRLVRREYESAGITRQRVQTGAVIITGETSRKENAGAVLRGLSQLAGDFVVATAGPDLESRLAARGSGAVEESEKTGRTVLHLDIGGGTSNLALIKAGEILDTGCLNVGGRLLRFDSRERVEFVSPVLQPLTDLRPGDIITEPQGEALARMLAEVLEMGVGLRRPEPILRQLITREGKLLDSELLHENMLFSFSGGVADCVEHSRDWKEFGDLGPMLGRAIRESRLCRGDYMLGKETIRATVIGAGCHTTQLSGSTVYYRNMEFPLQNVPVVGIPDNGEPVSAAIRRALSRQEEPVVLALKGRENPGYEDIAALAGEITEGLGDRPCWLCLRQDQAKALGQALALRLPPDRPVLCLDRIALGDTCYLDVGEPVGPAVPVVVKTLILGNQG